MGDRKKVKNIRHNGNITMGTSTTPPASSAPSPSLRTSLALFVKFSEPPSPLVAQWMVRIPMISSSRFRLETSSAPTRKIKAKGRQQIWSLLRLVLSQNGLGLK